ncbi:MAG: transketolase, partial [Gemmatimonadetes bacterium]|nr:transketolase [Gemmatimonadota bacterium]
MGCETHHLFLRGPLVSRRSASCDSRAPNASEPGPRNVAATLDRLCIDTLRTLAIDAIEEARSGHPGLPLGAAPMAYMLWRNHLLHDPAAPDWPNRDRFVLSAGHGSALLYSLLHLSGYGLGIDDLRAFRQLGSRTPGHPESHVTEGVEATTGPLGQGAANSVGMAMAERMLAHLFNRPGHEIVEHHTYALVSDGDLMEGVAAEAASIAGHLGLGKLIWLYDDNRITIDGDTSIAFSGEDVTARFEAYGWHSLRVEDGDHDIGAIDEALAAARAEGGRPSLIVLRTTIGFGSPNRANTPGVHGSPLGAAELAATKKALGWTESAPFHVPEAALEHFAEGTARGRDAHARWRESFEQWSNEFPDLLKLWYSAHSGELPDGWDAEIPAEAPGAKIATRKASHRVLNAIAARVPWLAGGSADLAASVLTRLGEESDFDAESGAGRNIHFGIREHAMGAIANGIAGHGGIRPFVGTFFVFSDYMRPPVRLAAMCGLPVIYLWSHDSAGLGEDGPTHQPVEHLASLRAIPGLTLLRPADATETAEAWRIALRMTEGPVAIVLSRQALPVLDGADPGGVRRGAYVVSDSAEPARAILIATGSEVSLALDAQARLEKGGIATRVVSMPSWELFEAQPAEYRHSVLPPEIGARVAVEAGVSQGWHRWTGDGGAVVACVVGLMFAF